MKFEMRKLILLHIILLFSVVAMAQTGSVASGVPYECRFEEGEDLSAWTLNYGTPNATDQWMFGTGAHSEGKRSLYVSSDGVNPSYGRNRNITVAYLRYKFPQTAQIIRVGDIDRDLIREEMHMKITCYRHVDDLPADQMRLRFL